MILAPQQWGTLSVLHPLDQLISDLEPKVSLIPLLVAQQCPRWWKLPCTRLKSDLTLLLLWCSPSSRWEFRKSSITSKLASLTASWPPCCPSVFWHTSSPLWGPCWSKTCIPERPSQLSDCSPHWEIPIPSIFMVHRKRMWWSSVEARRPSLSFSLPCHPNPLPKCSWAKLSLVCTPLLAIQIFSLHPVSTSRSVDSPGSSPPPFGNSPQLLWSWCKGSNPPHIPGSSSGPPTSWKATHHSQYGMWSFPQSALLLSYLSSAWHICLVRISVQPNQQIPWSSWALFVVAQRSWPVGTNDQHTQKWPPSLLQHNQSSHLFPVQTPAVLWPGRRG